MPFQIPEIITATFYYLLHHDLLMKTSQFCCLFIHSESAIRHRSFLAGAQFCTHVDRDLRATHEEIRRVNGGEKRFSLNLSW